MATELREDLEPHLFSGKSIRAASAGHLEKLLGLPKSKKILEAIHEYRCGGLFYTSVLDALDIFVDATEDEQRRVPREGPTVVVANHPFGILDGLVLLERLLGIRTDVKVLAEELPADLEEIRGHFIGCETHRHSDPAHPRIDALLRAKRWVEEGGLLVVFPAGDVSRLDIGRRQITDPPWNDTASWIARRSGAVTVPVYFHGKNSVSFHLLGLIHSRFRARLLGRELLKKQGITVRMEVGHPIPPRTLRSFESFGAATAYLRHMTYLLGCCEQPTVEGTEVMSTIPKEPIIEPVSKDLILAEIRSLPDGQLLSSHKQFSVYLARAHQIPHILNEIGRLREHTFRLVSKSTGKSIDLDRFDEHYHHLFVWDRESEELVGSYRLGLTDEILSRQTGLYTATLFKLKRAFYRELNPALELGRSFVRPRYQRHPASLMLLWKGIGRFVVENPRYHKLFGPVSISAKYQTVSHQLMVAFLEANHLHSAAPRLVRPLRAVPRSAHRSLELEAATEIARDIRDLSNLVAALEPDQAGIPILLKQYLNLGGEVLGFNVDTDFSNVVDGLMLVDLTRTNPAILNRYMGRTGAESFFAYHGVETTSTKSHEHVEDYRPSLG